MYTGKCFFVENIIKYQLTSKARSVNVTGTMFVHNFERVLRMFPVTVAGMHLHVSTSLHTH